MRKNGRELSEFTLGLNPNTLEIEIFPIHMHLKSELS